GAWPGRVWTPVAQLEDIRGTLDTRGGARVTPAGNSSRHRGPPRSLGSKSLMPCVGDEAIVTLFNPTWRHLLGSG
ncbi:hypothetical protein ACFL5O_06810, partial [Myxococcota bacterium]